VLPRPSNLLCIATLSLLVVGCPAPGPGVIRITNMSDDAVIVQLGGTSDDPEMWTYRVPKGADGALVGLGARNGFTYGRIRVLTEQCAVLWERRSDGDPGTIVVAEGRSVTWTGELRAPGNGDERLAETKTCA
jgi:hypothetical protein